MRMTDRVPVLVFLLLLAVGIGTCAPRGKGGGARGGTVANKAVVGEEQNCYTVLLVVGTLWAGELTHVENKSRLGGGSLENNFSGQMATQLRVDSS